MTKVAIVKGVEVKVGEKNYAAFPMTWFLNSDDLDTFIKEYKKQKGLNH